MDDSKRGTTHYLFTTMTPDEFGKRDPGVDDRAWFANSTLSRTRITFRAPIGWRLVPQVNYGVVLQNVYGECRIARVVLRMLRPGNDWQNHLDEIVEIRRPDRDLCE